MTDTGTVWKLFLSLALLISFVWSAPTSKAFDGLSLHLSTSTTPGNNSEGSLTKRDSILYDIWSDIPDSQKVTGSSAIYHKWDRSANVAYGITYLYGCTGILISDPGFMIVGKSFDNRNQLLHKD